VGGVRFSAGKPPLQRVGNPPVKVGRHPTLRDGAQADALICKQTDKQSGIVCNFLGSAWIREFHLATYGMCECLKIRNFSFQFPRKCFFF
jgi:hypothetical protein